MGKGSGPQSERVRKSDLLLSNSMSLVGTGVGHSCFVLRKAPSWNWPLANLSPTTKTNDWGKKKLQRKCCSNKGNSSAAVCQNLSIACMVFACLRRVCICHSALRHQKTCKKLNHPPSDSNRHVSHAVRQVHHDNSTNELQVLAFCTISTNHGLVAF